MNETSRTNRRIMAILLVAAGLFMIAVAPFLVQSTLDPMLEGLMKKVAEDPRFASGPTLMAIFYPLWRALIAGLSIAVAGVPTHFVRQATVDYLIGAVLGVVLVVVLLVPAIKQQLIGPPEPKTA